MIIAFTSYNSRLQVGLVGSKPPFPVHFLVSVSSFAVNTQTPLQTLPFPFSHDACCWKQPPEKQRLILQGMSCQSPVLFEVLIAESDEGFSLLCRVPSHLHQRQIRAWAKVTGEILILLFLKDRRLALSELTGPLGRGAQLESFHLAAYRAL